MRGLTVRSTVVAFFACLAVAGCEAGYSPTTLPAAPNRAPVATGSPFPQNVNIDVGQNLEVGLSGYFSDPDGDALSYAAASTAPTTLVASVSGSVLLMTTVGAGTATVTVTAQDPGGLTASLSFTLTVVLPNLAPQARGSIPNQTLTAGGSAATVDVSGSFTDPDGDALSYTASSSNIDVATTSVSGATVTVRPAGAGAATVTVTARDAGGLTASLIFAVSVKGIPSPDLVISVAPNSVTVAPGSKFVFRLAIRNQGDAVADATRAWTFVSDDATITISDEQVGEPADVPALKAGESAEGTNTITVSASARPDTIYVGECVDAVQGESDTSNNCSNALELVIRATSGDTAYITGPTTPLGTDEKLVSALERRRRSVGKNDPA